MLCKENENEPASHVAPRYHGIQLENYNVCRNNTKVRRIMEMAEVSKADYLENSEEGTPALDGRIRGWFLEGTFVLMLKTVCVLVCVLL